MWIILAGLVAGMALFLWLETASDIARPGELKMGLGNVEIEIEANTPTVAWVASRYPFQMIGNNENGKLIRTDNGGYLWMGVLDPGKWRIEGSQGPVGGRFDQQVKLRPKLNKVWELVICVLVALALLGGDLMLWMWTGHEIGWWVAKFFLGLGV